MAITAADIHNMSFAIDRKGYDVDEVDVFLEHVADEIDAMNNQIEQLEAQLEDARFGGFDAPAHIEAAPAAAAPVIDDAALAEKDARIAELEKRADGLARQLEAKKADDSAISQVLINAQRLADETVANAKAQSVSIVQDAQDEAQRILDQAEGEKQEVIDAIQKLEDDREDAREEYQDLLKDFISDATRKLAEIGGDAPALRLSAHARPQASGLARSQATEPASATGQTALPVQVPINASAAPTYTTPQATGPVVTPATPIPSAVEKDLSGFGDTDDDFEFEEID